MKRDIVSNNDKALDYAKRMKRLVDDAIAGKFVVPMRHGRVNLSALTAPLGFPRGRFDSNDLVKAELERLRTFVGEQPKASLTPSAPKEVKALEMRIQTLEKALLVKSIELEAMRDAYLRREHAEEHLLRTGRIIHPFRSSGPADSPMAK